MKRLKRYFFVTLMMMISFAVILPYKSSAAISVNAQSAVLIEQSTGRVLYEKGANEVRRIASITKIMTAILAIESGKLNEMVKVSNNAAGTEGSSLYLKQGEKIKLEDLVYGLMLRSGNDSAVAIAEHVGGSLDGFVYLMNEKAEEIGMKNTHFANPHGLDDHEDHYSTAYDMALLTRYAMMNDTYKTISGTKVHRAPNPNEGWDRVWHNKNRLLTEKYEYCTGGKTGYTKRAKRTLVTTATKNNMDLIAVTLNAPGDWNDHIYMYEKAFKQYENTNVINEGTVEKIQDSFYKGKVFVKASYSYPVQGDELEQFKVEYKVLKPSDDWDTRDDIPDVVGKVEVYFKDDLVKTIAIFYDKNQFEEKKKGFFEWFKSLFTAFIGVN